MGRRRRTAPPRQASPPIARSAEAEVRRRIRERGRITFAEFAEIALYHPAGGYYTQPTLDDYFTSPRVHPTFGALLARLAHRVWTCLERPSRLDVIELGSGGGQLAHDFTSYAGEQCSEFQSALRYLALDRIHSKERPAGVGFDRLTSSVVPLRNLKGLVMSNELVDAFPVHRFEIEAGAVREIYVTIDNDALREILGEPSTPLIEERLAKLDCRLPGGFRGEVNPGIGPLMTQIADALSKGVVLTIDYGARARRLYSSARRDGTLRTFQRHALGSDPYSDIGGKDLTASVDFTALEEEGERAGLRSLGMTTQARALSDLGIGGALEQPSWVALSPPARAWNRLALEELVRPEGLGGFKWLFQSKCLAVGNFESLLKGPPGCPGCATSAPLPLNVGDRVPLGEGRHPGAAFELEQLWPPPG